MLESCTKCLYDRNHPFGMSFSSNNKCLGCVTHDEKYEIDWIAKEELLKSFLAKQVKKTKLYDCVVPVMGDAEDYYVLNKVLQLGLKPLVVSVNDYFKNDIGWHNLHNLITYFDVDSLFYNPDINTYKELIKTSMRKYDHVLLPFLQLHTSYPVHVALSRNIPLVVWGQSQSVEQVGKFSHNDNVTMSEWNRLEHDLFNIDTNKLIGNGAQVLDNKLNFYRYPNIKILDKRGVQGIYLSNYYPWDPLKQNHSSLQFNFVPQVQSSTFDIYERAGNSIYYQLHDILKYKRVGYRKIRDQLTREIRHGRIVREEAEALEKYYSSQKVDVYEFFKWLGMSQSGMEWYIKYKLNGVSHLIGKNDNILINLPKEIDMLLGNHKKKSTENYLAFAKGIDI